MHVHSQNLHENVFSSRDHAMDCNYSSISPYVALSNRHHTKYIYDANAIDNPDIHQKIDGGLGILKMEVNRYPAMPPIIYFFMFTPCFNNICYTFSLFTLKTKRFSIETHLWLSSKVIIASGDSPSQCRNSRTWDTVVFILPEYST